MSEQFTLANGDVVEVGDEVIYAGNVGTLDYLHVANDVCRLKRGVGGTVGHLSGVETLNITARSFLREARLVEPKTLEQVVVEVVEEDRMAKARAAKAAKAVERAD